MTTSIRATIAGTLDRDPDIRYGRDGTATATLAVHDAGTGEHREVIIRGGMAENVALTFARGHRVIVTGDTERTEWTAEDGRTMSRSEFLATDVGASVQGATLDIHPATVRVPA